MGKGILEVFILYWPVFLQGALGTLKFAAIAVVGGTIVGTLISILHLAKNRLLSGIAEVYVNVLRGTPLLVQMYISYFFIPMVFPALNSIDKIYFVLFALTLNSSAYVSEVIRGGINAVDKGQTEAARSLGMSAKKLYDPHYSAAGNQEYSSCACQRIHCDDQGNITCRYIHVL